MVLRVEIQKAMVGALVGLGAALARSYSIGYEKTDWYCGFSRDHIMRVELSDEVENQHSFKT